jgi:hypothetical protein
MCIRIIIDGLFENFDGYIIGGKFHDQLSHY